jgi:hypothetical protein
MNIKAKYFVIGGVLVFLYLLKKKKDRDKQQEEEKLQMALSANELSASETTDMIRMKLDLFFQEVSPSSSEADRMNLVINLTSGLAEFKQKNNL